MIHALWFVLILTTNIFAADVSCFDDLPFQTQFDHFEVRSTSAVEVNSYYKESVLKAYASLLQYISDEKLNGVHRDLPIVIVHLDTQEFLETLNVLKNSSFNGSNDFHNSLSDISYRMYVNHKLNKACKKDFVFVRDFLYMDLNFAHLLAHEFFHILRSQKCGTCTNELWLEEGLAEYVASKTSGLIPNTAISNFGKIQKPISFFETNPDKFSVAHYGQSFLFLDFIFRDDLMVPGDSISFSNLKNFIKTGDTSCENLRAFFNSALLDDEIENSIPCEDWKKNAYKEFIFSLLDNNLARGGPVVSTLGQFKSADTLAPMYSFSMVNITAQFLNHFYPQIESSENMSVVFLIQTSEGKSLYMNAGEFYTFSKTIHSLESKNIKTVLLILFNFDVVPANYSIGFFSE